MLAHIFFISSMMLYPDSRCGRVSTEAPGEPDDNIAFRFTQAVVGLDFLGVTVWFSLFGGRIFLKKAFLFSSKDCSGTLPLILKL